MVVSFDLGGTFPSSQEVVDRLRTVDRFAEACTAARLHDRLQPSYRYSHEAEVLACEEQVELRLDAWQGRAEQRITVHPSGVATFEVTMALGANGVATCTEIEEGFYNANTVRYQPYLMHAYGQRGDPLPENATPDDRGVDLITPVTELRRLLAGVLRPRPERIVYPATDMRTVVCATVEDLDESGEDVVREFVRARRARAQLADAPVTGREVEGAPLDVKRPTVTVRRWGCVLFASCDVDAVLLVADSSEHWARRVAADCVAMAQRMWFVARTWVGVLDRVGTVDIRETKMDEHELRDLQQKVIDLSAAEYEIEDSLATVEAAGVMLRDSWHVELVRLTLECFEVGLQRRLIGQRLSAVARNHATVAEVLDRAHQNAARDQADRLQYLFAVAVAGGLAGLVLSIVDAGSAGLRVAIGVGTLLVVWALLAVGIWWVGRLKAPLTTAPIGAAPAAEAVQPTIAPGQAGDR